MRLDINNINNCQYYLFAIDEIPIYKRPKYKTHPLSFKIFHLSFVSLYSIISIL